MGYLSFARKYRPKTFDEIVGQEHIATTLKNAISLDQVAHAYLFSGSRGVGKTSTARILAKSLNCEKGPTEKPCDKCVACHDITLGKSLDVIETDGASNRGIDEIRSLKENTKFSPMQGKFKIYIIDEVHMLTQEAFNALLKTLEEPPGHVKFIFATTQAHKVPPTVISRCQRFDFKRIPARDIAEKLKEIKTEEKIDLKEDAIFLIARAADGSLRDAEVILDQLSSFTRGKIGPEDVIKVLGLLEQKALIDITEAILNDKKERILEYINTLIDAGKDAGFIALSLIEHFRNIMVVKVAEKPENYVGLSEDDIRLIAEQAERFSLDEILHIIYTIAGASDLMKKTGLGRIPLEVALIKLTDKSRFVDIKKIMDTLSSLKIEPAAVPGVAASPRSADYLTEEKEPAKEAKKSEEASLPVEAVSAGKDILALQKIKTSWHLIINFIRQKKMSVATFLSDGEPTKVKDNKLFIGFGPSSAFHREALEYNTNKDVLAEAIKNITGESFRIETEMLKREIKLESAPIEDEFYTADDDADPSRKIDPIVEAAIDKFEGKITGIEKTPREKK